MRYVIDTSTLSSLMRSEPAAARRLTQIQPGYVTVPQPVLAEIFFGLERLPRSKRRHDLERRFAQLARELSRLPWDDDVSACFGRSKAALQKGGRRVEDFDLAIAAHALSTAATLVTRNLRHFVGIPGLRVEDWG